MKIDPLSAGLTECLDEFVFEPSEIRTFARTGQIGIEDILPLAYFSDIAVACRGLFRMPLPLTRHIKDPEWHQVDKVTLFRNPHGIKERSHGMRFFSTEVAIAAAWADSMVQKLGGGLLKHGYREAGEALVNHTSNRSVINRMNGTPDSNAVIGLHLDPPEETGANVVLTLDPGVNLLNRVVVDSNMLNIYACEDVAELLGVPQPLHGFKSDTTRMSVVFTRFEA